MEQLKQTPTDISFANYLRVSNQICAGASSNVCCPNTEILTTTTPVTTRDSNEIPRRLPTVQEGCGHKMNSFKKIVGGEVSIKGSWPWIALIGYDDELAPFKCGGTLITARHVLTAAHCIRNDL